MRQIGLQLTNMTHWAQVLLAPALNRGGLAVDLTAGNGQDTLFLWHLAGPEGTVLAFDIQPCALDHTERRLADAGAGVIRLHAGQPLPEGTPGVFLAGTCHSRLPRVLRAAPAAVMANLGYLPGGDHALITCPDTTLQALRSALRQLAVGGRLVVTAYPGHPGGDVESRAVRELFASLDADHWLVLELGAANRPQAPLLLVAEKRAAAL